MDTATTQTNSRWPDDFPHRGWNYNGMHDYGIANHTCEYCNKQEVRYVHTVSHPNWPSMLEVGCVCCEKMIGTEEAREWESEEHKRARRKKNFLEGEWLTTQYGGLMRKYKWCRVTVARKQGEWAFWLNGSEHACRCPTEHEAKSLAFDLIDKPIPKRIRLHQLALSRGLKSSPADSHYL